MGHIRIGRLPKSARWREVVGLMQSDDATSTDVARATLLASEDYLRASSNDPALVRAYWVLVRLMASARGDDFAGELRRMALDVAPGTSTIAFVSAVSESVRRDSTEAADGSRAGELAGLALRRALTETVGTQGASMFGSTVDDLRLAFRAHSSRTYGLPARAADNKRGEGLGMVSFLLDNDRLTIDPSCTDSIAEFPGYRWAQKVDSNDKTRFATSTPVDHHADAMDARRYAVLELTAMLHDGVSLPKRSISGRPLARSAV